MSLALADLPAIHKAVMVVRCGDQEIEVAPGSATRALLLSADQFRTFQYYKGQKHYPGRYFSATENCHIGYESLLERACAMLADFCPDVSRVISQPFRLGACVNNRSRRYTADYLLYGQSGLTVVEVKPISKLAKPRVVSTLAWVRTVVENAGWAFEVFSEPDPVMFDNVQFFAGYRRPESVSPALLRDLRAHDLVGLSFGDAVRCIDGPAPRVRAALLHLLWRQELRIDLSRKLSATSLLDIGTRS